LRIHTDERRENAALYPLPKKICIVDDDDAVRDSMGALLGSYGIVVEGFPSADEFLACCGRSADCILLDLHMPNMDGLQLLAAMRERGFLLPVIMITGRGDDQLRSRALLAGAYALLYKPLEDSELLRCMACAMAAERRENPTSSGLL